MPPVDSGEKLSDEDVSKLIKWIRAGAPDPREDNSKAFSAKKRQSSTLR